MVFSPIIYHEKKKPFFFFGRDTKIDREYVWPYEVLILHIIIYHKKKKLLFTDTKIQIERSRKCQKFGVHDIKILLASP